MLSALRNLFTPANPRSKAVLALARIISQYDVAEMRRKSDGSAERRSHDNRSIAIGIWLVPIGSEEARFEQAVPAVTHDVRSEGFGVLIPMKIPGGTFLVAVPGEAVADEESWKFFQARVAHSTQRSGGWYQIGLQVTGVAEPDPMAMIRFRRHVNGIRSRVGSCASGESDDAETLTADPT